MKRNSREGPKLKHHSVLFLILAFTLSGCLTYESETGCKPKCNDLECGDDGCGGSCGECDDYELCEDGICVPISCCEGYPAGEYHISVSGIVLDFTTMQGVSVAVMFYDPFAHPPPPDPPRPPRTPPRSDDNGYFQLGCFDVTTVAIGMIVQTDDWMPDGTQGTYYPAGTGVAFWNNNSEKFCSYDAKAYAVPNTMVASLDADTSVDSAAYGFVMGFVADVDSNRVEGAVVKMGDGTDLVEVIYPDSTFTTFDDTATSVSGVFVLPHTNFALGITEITAVKDGMTFKTVQAAPKAGFCFLVAIEEES
jgi:hypothetical protein